MSVQAHIKPFKIMNNTQFLSADKRLFLIKYAWTRFNNQIITTQQDLAKTIKETDPGKGIEYIKEFNPSKNSFKAISKKQILNLVSWDTEATEFLSKHSFFNTVK